MPAWTAVPLLTACNAAGAGPLNAVSGTLLVSSLVLLSLLALAALAATLAYRLGRSRASQDQTTALRQARHSLRQWREVNDGWTWRSNTAHDLVLWQAPDGAAPVSLDALPNEQRALPKLFPVRTGPGLDALLASQQAFSNVRVLCSKVAHWGAAHWALSGSPCFDESGHFDGYAGLARPCDEADALQADAAALAPLLALHPAVLALDLGQGFVLRQVSPAAQSRWPTARAGTPAAHWLRGLPAVVSQTLQTLDAGQRVEVEGWRLSRFDLAGGAKGVLLVLASGPTVAAAGVSPEVAENDNFSITVSHDLRAPIRVVDGFTRIVKEDYGHLLDRVCNDHLDRVLGAAARMNLMIDAMLTLARLSSQPLARQPVNLSQLAAYVIDDLKRAAPEREVDVDIEANLTAQGDPTLLRLVLENLLGNAWKYTARSPRAQISMRRLEQTNGPAFEVRDNGAGFDMRSAERLFGLFQRLHSANDFPGHGVGLASVKRIVSRHGGDIWAEAEPGRGAAFRFTLAD